MNFSLMQVLGDQLKSLQDEMYITETNAFSLQITVGKASQQHPKATKSGKASYKTFRGDTVTLKPGTLVAVNLAKYEEWPQIGEVISSQQDTLTLSWYDGLYSTPWMKVKLKNGDDWKETVSKDTLIMYDITLTAGQRLRKDTVEKLKNSFENSNQDNVPVTIVYLLSERALVI